MNEYRIFIVGAEGHFIKCEPLVCRDDSEAVQNARRMLDGHDLEIWSGERFVMRLKSTHE